MAIPTTPEATDRLGNPLPLAPSAGELEHQADQLRIVSDAELSAGTINRVPVADLEQRRLRSLGR